MVPLLLAFCFEALWGQLASCSLAFVSQVPLLLAFFASWAGLGQYKPLGAPSPLSSLAVCPSLSGAACARDLS